MEPKMQFSIKTTKPSIFLLSLLVLPCFAIGIGHGKQQTVMDIIKPMGDNKQSAKNSNLRSLVDGPVKFYTTTQIDNIELGRWEFWSLPGCIGFSDFSYSNDPANPTQTMPATSINNPFGLKTSSLCQLANLADPGLCSTSVSSFQLTLLAPDFVPLASSACYNINCTGTDCTTSTGTQELNIIPFGTHYNLKKLVK